MLVFQCWWAPLGCGHRSSKDDRVMHVVSEYFYIHMNWNNDLWATIYPCHRLGPNGNAHHYPTKQKSSSQSLTVWVMPADSARSCWFATSAGLDRQTVDMCPTFPQRRQVADRKRQLTRRCAPPQHAQDCTVVPCDSHCCWCVPALRSTRWLGRLPSRCTFAVTVGTSRPVFTIFASRTAVSWELASSWVFWNPVSVLSQQFTVKIVNLGAWWQCSASLCNSAI